MQCTLHIPSLIPPREVADSVWHALHAPELKTLLGRARYTHEPQTDAAALLCELFGVVRQHDYPLAPLLAQQAGVAVDQGYWLNATPGHLQTRRNALVLADPATLTISAAESSALAATLAEHLREEHITLHAPQPERWFLHCDVPPVMTTSGLGVVAGNDVRAFLPQGADSRRWHRILTEMQMLLHAHPVNEARESLGQTPLNTVWLWSGGTLPAAATKRFERVLTTDEIAGTLAHHAGCHIDVPPSRLTPETWDGSSHFCSTALLSAPMRQGDLQAWSAAVTALNADWFQPLLNALKSRRLSELTVLSNDHAGTHRFQIRPQDLIKFWRKNKYLQ